MVLITLIGESQAKPGKRFYFMGPQTDCKECRLRAVCFNLEQGSQYEVVALRDQKHECMATEDTVRAVEVEKVPIAGAVPKKIAIDGSMVTFSAPQCEQLGCENYMRCHPVGIEKEKKFSIVGIDGDAECPIGSDIVLVRMI